MGLDVVALGAIELVDEHGTDHRLGDTWRDRPVILVFLRHFG